MKDMDSNEYFSQKKALLRECVTLSEELLSSIEDMDTVNSVLSKRSEKIQLIQNLDHIYGKTLADSLSSVQKEQFDQIVSLLLALDRDTVKKMKNEQAIVKNSMKTNTNGQKLINYTGKHTQTSGRLLDKKK